MKDPVSAYPLFSAEFLSPSGSSRTQRNLFFCLSWLQLARLPGPTWSHHLSVSVSVISLQLSALSSLRSLVLSSLRLSRVVYLQGWVFRAPSWHSHHYSNKSLPQLQLHYDSAALCVPAASPLPNTPSASSFLFFRGPVIHVTLTSTCANFQETLRTSSITLTHKQSQLNVIVDGEGSLTESVLSRWF